MDALDAKLGPVFDKIVLQVHSNNHHALRRFEMKYGFVRDGEYNQTWTVKGKEYHLIGMSKTLKGDAVEAARLRRDSEARMKCNRGDDEQLSRRSRPRRAATCNVNYKDPDDPGIIDLFHVYFM